MIQPENHLLRPPKQERHGGSDVLPLWIMPFAAAVQHDIETAYGAEAVACQRTIPGDILYFSLHSFFIPRNQFFSETALKL